MFEFLQSPAFVPAAWAAVGGFLVAGFIFRLRLGRLQEKEKAAQQTVAELRSSESNLKADLYDLRSTESSLLKRQAELEARLRTMIQKEEAAQPLSDRISEVIVAQVDQAQRAAHASLRQEVAPLLAFFERIGSQLTDLRGSLQTTTTSLQAGLEDVSRLMSSIQEKKPEPAKASSPAGLKFQVPEEKLFEGFLVEETSQKAENAANDLRAALNLSES